MHPETELTVAAVLRRNAHELRNKLSALISAVDVMGSLATASPSLFNEALSLLAESGSDLRELANVWTTCARDMFAAERADVSCSQLAALVTSGSSVDVALDADDDLEVRIDPRIVEAVSQRIAVHTQPNTVVVRQEIRHNLPFVTVVFETSPDRAQAAAASEPIVAMLNQLNAHPRIDGNNLIVQMPAQQVVLRAAS